MPRSSSAKRDDSQRLSSLDSSPLAFCFRQGASNGLSASIIGPDDACRLDVVLTLERSGTSSFYVSRAKGWVPANEAFRVPPWSPGRYSPYETASRDFTGSLLGSYQKVTDTTLE